MKTLVRMSKELVMGSNIREDFCRKLTITLDPFGFGIT